MRTLKALVFLAAAAEIGYGAFITRWGYSKGFSRLEFSLPSGELSLEYDISVVAMVLGAMVFFGGLLSLIGFAISLRGYRTSGLYLLSGSIMGLAGVPATFLFALAPSVLFVAGLAQLLTGKPSRRKHPPSLESGVQAGRRGFPRTKR